MKSKNNKFRAIKSITALLTAFVIIFNSALPTVFAGEIIPSTVTAVENPIEIEPLPEEPDKEALPEEVAKPPEIPEKPEQEKANVEMKASVLNGDFYFDVETKLLLTYQTNIFV